MGAEFSWTCGVKSCSSESDFVSACIYVSRRCEQVQVGFQCHFISWQLLQRRRFIRSDSMLRWAPLLPWLVRTKSARSASRPCWVSRLARRSIACTRECLQHCRLLRSTVTWIDGWLETAPLRYQRRLSTNPWHTSCSIVLWRSARQPRVHRQQHLCLRPR